MQQETPGTPPPAQAPRPKKPLFKRWWFWVIVALVVIVIVGSIGGNDKAGTPEPSGSGPAQNNGASIGEEEAQQDEPPPSTADPEPEPVQEQIAVTATELIEAYDANEVAADNEYKGQNLVVTGTVKNIGKDIVDAAYVTLQNDADEYAIISVQCYFADDDLDDIATLKEGDKVAISGKCNGVTLNVMLKDCSLESVE